MYGYYTLPFWSDSNETRFWNPMESLPRVFRLQFGAPRPLFRSKNCLSLRNHLCQTVKKIHSS